MTPIERKTKEWLAATSTPAYLEARNDKDPARLKAAALKRELDQMTFDALSPKAKLRELVEAEIVEERRAEAKAAEERAAHENAQAQPETQP